MHIDIDTREVACKLSFLVGKVIVYRNGYPHDDAASAVQVVGVLAENTPGLDGFPRVSIHTSLGGVLNVTSSKDFNRFLVLCDEGVFKPLSEFTDDLGIVF